MGDTAPTLSDRQRETLGLVADGLSTSEIAAALGCKPRTAKFHVDQLRQKFGVEKKRDLIRIAREMDL